MLARLDSLLLLVLTRDGVLHRLEGDQQSTEPPRRATAMAVCDGGRVALLACTKTIVAMAGGQGVIRLAVLR
jgi:hypothetical protein